MTLEFHMDFMGMALGLPDPSQVRSVSERHTDTASRGVLCQEGDFGKGQRVL